MVDGNITLKAGVEVDRTSVQKSVAELESKIKSLTDTLSSMTKKRDALIGVGAAGSDTARELSRDIDRVQTALKEATTSLDSFNVKQKEMAKDTSDVSTEYLDLISRMKHLKGILSTGMTYTGKIVSDDEIIRAKQSLLEVQEAIKHFGETPVEIKPLGIEGTVASTNRLLSLVDTLKASFSGIGRVAERGFVAARRGASLLLSSIKSLISHMKSLVSHMKSLRKHSNGANFDTKKLLRTIVKYGFGVRSVYMLYRKLRQAAVESLGELAKASDEFNETMSSLKTNTTQLKGSLGAVLQPIVTALTPALNTLMTSVDNLLVGVAKFVAVMTGQDFIYRATASQQNYADSVDKTSKSLKEANKQLGKYDELNVIASQTNDGATDSSDKAIEYNKELINTESAISQLAQRIKEAWSIGDFTELGKDLAEGVEGIAKKIEEKVPKLDGAAKKVATSISTFLNGLVADPTKVAEIGTALGGIVNVFIDFEKTLFDPETGIDFYGLGKTLGLGLTNFIKEADIPQAVTNISLRLNGIVKAIQGFLDGVDFDELATKLSDGLNGLIDNFDAEAFGRLIHDALKKGISFLTTLLKRTDFDELGKKIGEFLKELDLGDIAQDLADLFLEILKAGWALIKGSFDQAPVETLIVATLIALKSSTPILSAAAGLGNAIGLKIAAVAGTAAAGYSFGKWLRDKFPKLGKGADNFVEFLLNPWGVDTKGSPDPMENLPEHLKSNQAKHTLSVYEKIADFFDLPFFQDEEIEVPAVERAPVLPKSSLIKEAQRVAQEAAKQAHQEFDINDYIWEVDDNGVVHKYKKMTLGNLRELMGNIKGTLSKGFSEMDITGAFASTISKGVNGAAEYVKTSPFGVLISNVTSGIKNIFNKNMPDADITTPISNGATKANSNISKGLNGKFTSIVNTIASKLGLPTIDVTTPIEAGTRLAEASARATGAKTLGGGLGSLITTVRNKLKIDTVDVTTPLSSGVSSSSSSANGSSASTLGGKFTALRNKVQGLLKLANVDVSTPISSGVSSAQGNVSSGSINKLLATVKSTMQNKLKIANPDLSTPISNAAKSTGDDINNQRSTLGSRLVNIGKYLLDGISSGLNNTSKLNSLKSAVTGVATNIANVFSKALGIASPSRVMASIAQWIPAGVTKGIEDNEDNTFKEIDSYTSAMERAFNVKIPDIAMGGIIPNSSSFVTSMTNGLQTGSDIISQVMGLMANQDKSPIILQLNGSTVAQVVWDEEEKRYKQTGRYA